MPKSYSKICSVCYANFTTTRSNQKYCTPNCRTVGKLALVRVSIRQLRADRRAKGLCVECGNRARQNMAKCVDCAARHRDLNTRYARMVRMQVLIGYGCVCDCCGEHRWEMLAIDHVNGRGAEHRRAGRDLGHAFYKRLITLGFPKDEYRLLCHNCNCALGHYGYCPHEREREAALEAVA